MEQKRKVKSLISQRWNKKESILTTILLILSLILCIGTATLITSTVRAFNPNFSSNNGAAASTNDHPNTDAGGISADHVYTDAGGISADHVYTDAGGISADHVDTDHDFQGKDKNTGLGDEFNLFNQLIGERLNHGNTSDDTDDDEDNGNNDNNQPVLRYATFKAFDYTGIDNIVEVLYRMNFIDPLDFTKLINSIYVIKGSYLSNGIPRNVSHLYITPNPVVVNPATRDGKSINRNSNVVTGNNIYSHILGGTGNIVKSDNITLIAGNSNEVGKENTNATILGGIGNFFGDFGNGTRVPFVSIGGQNNTVLVPLSNVFIGGKGNYVSGGTAAIMLGGENNRVESDGLSNITIGGKNVTVTGIGKIFVYSNNDEIFIPQSSNAFYLNMQKGVGINTGGVDEGLSVAGAIYVGEVDIYRENCIEKNYGVIGSYNGCLVGCTKVSGHTNYHVEFEHGGGEVGGYMWEMLDLGDRCKQICKNHPESCALVNDTAATDEENNKTYIDAQCTNNVNTGNAEICSRDSNFTGGYIEFYKNVIFETTLIDSDTPCPEGQENQCIYKCKLGYHLTGSVENNNLSCYKDCVLTGEFVNDHVGVNSIKHNERIRLYNKSEVQCSNDKFTFPKNESPDQCNKNEHDRNAVCNNGVLYLATERYGTTANLNKRADDAGYKYEYCGEKPYSCNTTQPTGYFLDQSSIRDYLGDSVAVWETADRSRSQGERGIYELCLDYNINTSPSPTHKCVIGNAKGGDGSYTKHYKLVGCQEHYSTGENNPYECKKSCQLKDINGNQTRNDPSGGEYYHGRVVEGYKNNDVTCVNTCETELIVCNDGVWRMGEPMINGEPNINGEPVTTDFYNDCTLHSNTCDGYNISSSEYDAQSSVSSYDACEEYNAEGKFRCNPSTTKYKLTNCDTGYHADGAKKHCVPNRGTGTCTKPGHSSWDRSGGEESNYPGNEALGSVRLPSGQYIRWWIGDWDDTNGWDTTHQYPSGACNWSCNDKYHRSGDNCVENTCSTSEGLPGSLEGVVKSLDQQPNTNDQAWKYVEKDASISTKRGACEWTCDRGWHYVNLGGNEKCTPNTCANRGNKSTVGILTGSGKPDEDDKDWEYTDSSAPGACEWTCKTGYHHVFDINGHRCEANICSSTGLPGLPTILDGVITGSALPTTHDQQVWTYTSNSNPGACEWTCKNGYERVGNKCALVEPECGADNGKSLAEQPTQLCRKGNVIGFSYDDGARQWIWQCKNSITSVVVDCSATKANSTTLEKGNLVGYRIGLLGKSRVKSFKKWDGSELPSDVTTSIISELGEIPVYIRLDHGVVYYYSEADTIYMNEDSAQMFQNFPNIISIDLADLDASKVDDMFGMFSDCSSLTEVNFGNNFDTSSLENMSQMFANCSSLTGLDLGDKFDTSSVKNMGLMFSDCSSLTEVNFGDKFDTSSVERMDYMFANCSSLTGLDLGDKFDTSSVKDMQGMFAWCSSLIELNLGDNFDTRNVTGMNSMFYRCSSLTGLDLGNKFDTSSVENMQGMFLGCTNLRTIYATDSFISDDTRGSTMFYNCNSLVGGAGTSYKDAKVINGSYARIDGGPSNPGYFTYKAPSS